MKKIKYVMPILGLSAITAASIPLAGCSSTTVDGVEVNKHEWADAFDYLMGKEEGAAWKMIDGDLLSQLSILSTGVVEYSETSGFGFNDEYGTYDAFGLSRGGMIHYEHLSSISVNKILYDTYRDAIESDGSVFTYASYSPKSDITLELSKYLNFFQPYFSLFKYDKETKCYECWGEQQYSETQKMIVASSVKFNSNKKITLVDSKAFIHNSEGNIETIHKIVMHPQYGNVKIDIDQEYIDRAKRHCQTMPEDGKLVVDFLKKDYIKSPGFDEGLLLKIVPTKTYEAYKGCLQIKESNSNADNLVNFAIVYINDEKVTTFKLENDQIIFNVDLKPTDTIYIGFGFSPAGYEKDKLSFEFKSL